MIGTYKIQNTINGKCYFGSSIDIHKRFIQHKSCLRRNIHHCTHLQNAWNKYGESAFIFEVIEICDECEILYKENLLLETKNIYNSLKEAYSVKGNNHPMYGKKHTFKSKAKIRLARSNQIIKHSYQTKMKISKSNKGRKVPREHILNMVKARNGIAWNKGIKTGIEPANKIILDSELIIELYNSGESIETIRKKMNVSWDVIKRILTEKNIKTRSIKQQKIITDGRKRTN